VSDIISEIGF